MIEPREVLAATRATEFAPGSNRKGEMAGATWRYLLPSIERERVLVAGNADGATRAALAAVARELVVVPSGRVRPNASPASIRVVDRTAVGGWLAERPASSIDLAWIGAGAPAALDPGGPLGRLLAPDAVVVRERRGPPMGRSEAASESGTTIDVRPDRGEIRSAVARGDEGSARLLADRGLAGPSIRLPGPRRLARLMGRILPTTSRSLELTIAGDGTTLPAPPTYVGRLAAEAGSDVSGLRCALAAPGDYNTQKVLLLLREPDASKPTIVVKVTRDPSVNRRLETERDALRRLEGLAGLAAGRVPRVVFAGRHAGLAVVGETALGGASFQDRARGAVATELALDAISWLTELAAATARPAPASAVGEAISELHAQFVALCRPTADEAARLEAAIDAVARSERPLPVVFQHGDPGTWNLLVGEDGRVAFLDWENADEAGMPLWDLFYLLRSLAVGAARRAGVRRRLTAVDRFLFGQSPLSDLIVGSIDTYASRLGLDPRLIEPLFHLCWMHQALKEATRTDPARVRDGHYNRLLRLGFERRTAPTLARLFAGGAG